MSEDDLRSRTDQKRARRMREDALARLASELCALRRSQLDALDLPESVLEAIDELARIKSLPARARQERVVRSALRDAAWPEIRARLDQLRVHGTTANVTPRDVRAREWALKLAGEGTPAIDELLQTHPSVDRHHLARLVRHAQSDNAERRRRAETELIRTLRSLFA